MNKAIFLDRDGVICENRTDHVKNWGEFEFIPGAKESLAKLSTLDIPIVVVTNQAVIGRGQAPASAIEEIHSRMVEEITAAGGRIDRVFYCPHRPEDKCNCRKPRPGMLLAAAAEMNLALYDSYMIGDAATDIMAGQQVGCTTMLVLTGRGLQQLVPASRSARYSFRITRSINTAVEQIIKTEQQNFLKQPWPQPLPALGAK